MGIKLVNGIETPLTAEEEAEIVAKNTEEKRIANKLDDIREMRKVLLDNSDWKVTMAKEQGTNLSTSFKNWRQGLRDIPSTYTTESELDEILARDSEGNLTHSVWSE
tara:strand:- start:1337 stop:1657 length:321 start_codon:yes stop_codon:yes gene_type:complete